MTLAHWLPGVFDAVMIRLGPSSYKDAQAHAEAAAAGDGAGTQLIGREFGVLHPPYKVGIQVESGAIGSLRERRKCVPFPLAFSSAMKDSASDLRCNQKS